MGVIVVSIAAGHDIDYQGASGPVDLDENGDVIGGSVDVWSFTATGSMEMLDTFQE